MTLKWNIYAGKPNNILHKFDQDIINKLRTLNLKFSIFPKV